MIMFKKAEKKKAKLRLALSGTSGSGKTYGALQIAKGIGGKIAVLDTERGSASLYSDTVDFDVVELGPPYEPERFIEIMDAAAKAGYDVLIIDSITHEWKGAGGMLEIVDNIARAKFRGNSYAAWNEGDKRHRRFIDAMLHSPLHVIVTMRSKAVYVEGERNGKKTIEKQGAAPEQRDGIEYEFTAVLDLTVDGNLAVKSKDRTRLFSDPFRITEDTGRKLREWLESGAEVKPEPKPEPVKHIPATAETLAELANQYAGEPEEVMLDDLNETMREAAEKKGVTFEAIGDTRELSEPMAKWLVQRNIKLKVKGAA
jgi:hypothetical protein